MLRFLILLSASVGMCGLALGQHAFYLQALQEGKSAMADGKWELAGKRLEIAAFGLLEEPNLAAEAYVRLCLVAERLGDPVKHAEFMKKAKALLPDPPQKPAALSASQWDEYLVMRGLKKPPKVEPATPPLQATTTAAPPLQATTTAAPPLQATAVAGNPPPPVVEDEAFWLQRISDHLAAREYGRVEKAIEDGLGHYPTSLPLLERAINFSVRYNRERQAMALCQRAIKLDPICSIANYFLGIQAVKERRFADAKTHYALMTVPYFGVTGSLQKRLEESYSSKSAREQKPPAAPPPKDAGISGSLARDIAAKEAAVAAHPDDAQAQFDLVELYLANNDLENARRLLPGLGRSESQNPRYAEVFARYHYQKQDYRKNIDNIAGKSRLTPKTRLYLGLSYYRLGEFREARQTLAGLDRALFPELEPIDRDIAAHL